MPPSRIGSEMKLEFQLKYAAFSADFKFSVGNASLTSPAANYEAQINEIHPQAFSVIFRDKVYDCYLETLSNGSMEVIVNGIRIPVGINDPKRLSHSTGAGGHAGGRAVLTSPMPGKVVRVLCSAGNDVAEGQGLLVVEAMKMQNEVQAPKAGKVAEINVSEGQTVNAGETLVVVE